MVKTNDCRYGTIIPSAMYLEMAAEQVEQMVKDAVNPDSEGCDSADFVMRGEERELEVFGESRAMSLGATGLSNDFKIGFILGMQTARILLNTMPSAVFAKVKL